MTGPEHYRYAEQLLDDFNPNGEGMHAPDWDAWKETAGTKRQEARP